MENLLETFSSAPGSPVISVESDEPDDSDIIPTNQQEEVVVVEAEQPEGSARAIPKGFQPQAGIAMFWGTRFVESSNNTVKKTNESAQPNWTDWKRIAKLQKNFQRKKAMRAKIGASDTDVWKRKMADSLFGAIGFTKNIHGFFRLLSRYLQGAHP